MPDDGDAGNDADDADADDDDDDDYGGRGLIEEDTFGVLKLLTGTSLPTFLPQKKCSGEHDD